MCRAGIILICTFMGTVSSNTTSRPKRYQRIGPGKQIGAVYPRDINFEASPDRRYTQHMHGLLSIYVLSTLLVPGVDVHGHGVELLEAGDGLEEQDHEPATLHRLDRPSQEVGGQRLHSARTGRGTAGY